MPKLTPNRVATWLTAASGAAAAIAVPVANLDPTDLLPGLGAIAVAFVTWMQGWQKHEARRSLAPQSEPVLDSGVASREAIRALTDSISGQLGQRVAVTGHVPPDEDNSVLEAVDGDALAPTMPKIGGDE